VLGTDARIRLPLSLGEERGDPLVNAPSREKIDFSAGAGSCNR
jgi:hypothetical protein